MTEGPHKRTVMLGIYEINGGTLEACSVALDRAGMTVFRDITFLAAGAAEGSPQGPLHVAVGDVRPMVVG